MPIYEYECSSCDHHFDLIRKISDEPLIQCPECGKDTLVKLVSAAGFQLKGTGWYATDFKNKSTAPVESSSNKTDSVKKTDTSKPQNKSSEGDSK